MWRTPLRMPMLNLLLLDFGGNDDFRMLAFGFHDGACLLGFRFITFRIGFGDFDGG